MLMVLTSISISLLSMFRIKSFIFLIKFMFPGIIKFSILFTYFFNRFTNQNNEELSFHLDDSAIFFLLTRTSSVKKIIKQIMYLGKGLTAGGT